MKREEIIAKWDGMTARERDAWVAEVVFGKPTLSYADVDDLWVESGGVGTLDTYVPLPQYTTSISAAWAVQERFFACRIEGLGNSGYECEIYNGYGLSVTIVRSGEYTAPEAICLAALIAKLTEVSADVAV